MGVHVTNGYRNSQWAGSAYENTDVRGSDAGVWVPVTAGWLLAVRGEEVADPLDRLAELTCPRQGDDPEVVVVVEVEAGALHHEDLLL